MTRRVVLPFQRCSFFLLSFLLFFAVKSVLVVISFCFLIEVDCLVVFLFVFVLFSRVRVRLYPIQAMIVAQTDIKIAFRMAEGNVVFDLVIGPDGKSITQKCFAHLWWPGGKHNGATEVCTQRDPFRTFHHLDVS